MDNGAWALGLGFFPIIGFIIGLCYLIWYVEGGKINIKDRKVFTIILAIFLFFQL